jgi:hypothetical protein
MPKANIMPNANNMPGLNVFSTQMLGKISTDYDYKS